MESLLLIAAVAVGSALLGVLGGAWLLQVRARRRREDAESQAARILEAANADVERLRHEAELAGREEAYRAKQEWEREEARRREELDRAEDRIEERRSSLDRKYDLLVEKDRQLENRQVELDNRQAELEQRRAECDRLEARVLKLDRDIICAERKGGSARLDYMLERNFMMQLHEASRCSSRKMPAAVMNARLNPRCERR